MKFKFDPMAALLVGASTLSFLFLLFLVLFYPVTSSDAGRIDAVEKQTNLLEQRIDRIEQNLSALRMVRDDDERAKAVAGGNVCKRPRPQAPPR